MQSIPEGSSPRMRGTHLVHLQLDDRAGIIPAYAGNTFEGVGPCVFCGDHPRVCGEHMSNFTYWKLHEGSSPRMRGTPPFRKEVIAMCGIIPAYAGNTGCMRPVFSIHKDHPRVCGEHMLRERRIVWQAGSSPRMRGTRHRRIGHGPVEGIIPAYAGNTFYKKCGCVRHWDHPRVCGEHNRIVGIIAVILGSSPRMRGTHAPRRIHRYRRGIIPAYAGNTSMPFATPPVPRDHPRVCGEHG